MAAIIGIPAQDIAGLAAPTDDWIVTFRIPILDGPKLWSAADKDTTSSADSKARIG